MLAQLGADRCVAAGVASRHTDGAFRLGEDSADARSRFQHVLVLKFPRIQIRVAIDRVPVFTRPRSLSVVKPEEEI